MSESRPDIVKKQVGTDLRSTADSVTVAAPRTVAPAGLPGVLGILTRNYVQIDWAVTIYLAFTAISAALVGHNLAFRWQIVFVHAVMIVGVYVITSVFHDWKQPLVRVVRILYFPLIVTYFYEESTLLMQLFSPEWFDQQLIAVERAILGVSTTLWVQPWQSPLLSEFMMLSYFSYYPLVAVPPLVLVATRHYWRATQLVWAMSLAFFISFIGFYLYPIQGPRYEFAGLYERELTGFIFVPLMRTIMNTASIHGGCMPSSHVAVALVILFVLWRQSRRTGWLLLPVVVPLCLATVYGRFHYVSDVIGGVLVAVVALIIAVRYPISRKLFVGEQDSIPQPRHMEHAA